MFYSRETPRFIFQMCVYYNQKALSSPGEILLAFSEIST